MVPVSSDGAHLISKNEIILASGGQRVFLEIRISNWDPDRDGSTLLKSWQADLNDAGYSSGDQGILIPASEICSTDRYCRVAFGGVCSFTGAACIDHDDCELAPVERCGGSRCNFPPLTGGFCEPGFIGSGRSDYVFLSVANLPAVDLSTPRFRFGSAASDSLGVPDPGVSKYAGTLVLDVPLNALGSFRIGLARIAFRDELLPTLASTLVDQNNDILDGFRLFSAIITIGESCDRPAACNDNDSCSDDQCGCLDSKCLPSRVCTNVANFDSNRSACSSADGSLCDLPTGWWGDFNDDGGVDIRDYQLLQTCFGSFAFGSCDRVNMDERCDIGLRDLSEYTAVLSGPAFAP